MIIQRKIEMDVPSGLHIYWEDIATEEVPDHVLDFLKSLNDYVGTEYRIIHGEEYSTAIVTQPPLPKKEVEWSKSK